LFGAVYPPLATCFANSSFDSMLRNTQDERVVALSGPASVFYSLRKFLENRCGTYRNVNSSTLLTFSVIL